MPIPRPCPACSFFVLLLFFVRCVVNCFTQDILTLLLVLGVCSVGAAHKLVAQVELGDVCLRRVIGCDKSAIALEVVKFANNRW